MSEAGSFFVTGGTVPTDSASYVARQADKDLLAALLKGEYCFVLNSRQMGKSSLSVRTMNKLREAGVKPIFLDLTRFGGASATPEQWYVGLLAEIGRVLNLRRELLAYWKENTQFGLVPRFFGALREIALEQVEAPLVVFVDEIDAIRSLPFSCDEFFAAVRECYNRRTQDPAFTRLTFCLVGSATPSDLIQDTRTSPFNIGKKIELRDFTEQEVLPLAQGIPRSQAQALVRRAFHWTNGHPFLTQALCTEIAQDESIQSAADVDRLVERLFFEAKAREHNVNLADVSNRLLSSYLDPNQCEEHRAGILDLYRQVLQGRPKVLDDETKRHVAILKLSGITRTVEGALQVRNRIYERVFNRSWIAQNLPDAEVRRQRVAVAKARWQIGGIASIVVLGMAILTTLAVRNATRAQLYLYYASMKNAQLAYQSGAFEQLDKLLKDTKDSPARGWEWGYWKRLAHQEEAILTTHPSRVNATLSRDGRFALSASNGLLQLHDAQTRQLIYERKLPETMKWPIPAFSPDGTRFVISGGDEDLSKPGFAEIRETATGAIIPNLQRRIGHRTAIWTMEFSPDGKRIVTGGMNDGVKVWEAVTAKEIKLPNPILPRNSEFAKPCFSPDGKHIAVTFMQKPGDPFSTAIFDAETGKKIWQHSGTNSRMVQFSPDGKSLFLGNAGQKSTILNASDGNRISTLDQEDAFVVCVSKDGYQIATGDSDGQLTVSTLVSGKSQILRGHSGMITGLTFFPNGKHLLSSSEDLTVRTWSTTKSPTFIRESGISGICAAIFNPITRELLTARRNGWVKIKNPETGLESTFQTHQDLLIGAAYAYDGRSIVTLGGKTAIIWDAKTHKKLQMLALEGYVTRAAFSPDSTQLLIATVKRFENSSSGTIALWNLKTGKTTHLPQKTGSWGVAFLPNGSRFVTGGADNIVKIYDTKSLQLLMSLKGHRYCINSVAISPDGERIATAAEDNSAILWDVRTGQRLYTLLGHRARLYDITFSPDGKRVATCSADKTVKLWDSSTGEETLTLTGGKTDIFSASFSPDGHQIVGGEWFYEGREEQNFDAIIWTSDDTNAKESPR